MHTTVDSLVRRSELTDRMQAVLRKADGKVNMYCAMHERGIFFQSPNRSLITKRTACCELEWLVVHSSLSNDEAALACELIFSLFNQPLRCFTFSDVQIEDGSFTFFPETTRSRLLTASTMKLRPYSKRVSRLSATHYHFNTCVSCPESDRPSETCTRARPRPHGNCAFTLEPCF